ncbi:MAG: PqqD family protein [Bacilli bacterium]|jgi:hypothetical protein|nr:PqqD family protein [Bacilli bacterium]
MSNKPLLQSNEDVLKIVYKIADLIKYDINEDGIVTVYRPYDHPIQNFFRKLKLRIPKEKKMELDQKSSFVFKQIDGEKTIEEIGKLVEEEFQDETNPVYENLLLFLNHIEVNEKFIKKV